MSHSVIAGIVMRDLARSLLDSGASSGSRITTREICDPEHRCNLAYNHTFGKPPLWPF